MHFLFVQTDTAVQNRNTKQYTEHMRDVDMAVEAHLVLRYRRAEELWNCFGIMRSARAQEGTFFLFFFLPIAASFLVYC